MSAVKILPDIYWVGALDWNIRNFHGHTYNTRRGATYNAYLILDEKPTLVDTVHGEFAAELIDNIREVIDPAKIAYIIANHAEMDHSAALPEVLKVAPHAKIFGTAKCKDGLERHYYGNWDFQVVKTHDRLKLGKRTLSFIEAPMLHWPDSMFTYVIEDGLLLSNDAFGQHYATKKRFNDEVDQLILMEESSKYYANILWPFSALMLKKIEEIQKSNIPINIIAPAHGLIWRKNPSQIIERYVSWARNETKKKVVMMYETMWGSTEKMAQKIKEGLTAAGIPVKLFDVNKSDRTEVIHEMLDTRGFLFGSSTHDNDMLPNIAGFMEFLKGLKPKNRIAGVFGSYGWAGGGVESIENKLKDLGVELTGPSLAVKYVPSKDDLAKCLLFGKEFARRL